MAGMLKNLMLGELPDRTHNPIINLTKNKVYNTDCLEGMKEIPDNSVDSIITDPPYQYLNHKLDVPFDELEFFTQCKRVLKKEKSLIFFGRGIPYSKWIITCSELGFKWKEEIIWSKPRSSSPFGVLGRVHENISLFGILNTIKIDSLSEMIVSNKIIECDAKRILSSIKKIKNYEDFVEWKSRNRNRKFNKDSASVPISIKAKDRGFQSFKKHSEGAKIKSILKVNNEQFNYKHPTMKPLELMKVLVKVGSNENDVVLDPFMGSGTTAIACLETNRNFIGFEIDKDYCGVCNERIDQWRKQC